jgi:rhamnulokinase
LDDVHRFANGPVQLGSTYYWDALRLFSEIKTAIALAGRGDAELATVGVDTWGVDFGLLGHGDRLLANPFHYRDPRTNDIFEQAFAIIPKERIFERTGLQFLQFNTLFQLMAFRFEGSPLLDQAETLLMMPGLFNFWLTGRKVVEFTTATTTQFYDPQEKRWATDLLEAANLPTHILPEIVASGSRLGPLLPVVAEETGAKNVTVVAGACHDTAAAVAAVPLTDRPAAFISSGTWSLMGTELAEPIITAKAMRYNFTNEGGVGGRIRFLTNIMGLWLIQESQRIWRSRGEDLSWDHLMSLARQAAPLRSLVDPDDDAFMQPGDMPARIADRCLRSGEPAPTDQGAVLRCAMESLALKYRYTLECLEDVVGKSMEVIHIVGGGTRNTLLCQWTADATNRLVIAGPTEATATGNLMMQAIGLGDLASVEEGRALVRASFRMTEYEPTNTAAWEGAYGRFRALLPERN